MHSHTHAHTHTRRANNIQTPATQDRSSRWVHRRLVPENLEKHQIRKPQCMRISAGVHGHVGPSGGVGQVTSVGAGAREGPNFRPEAKCLATKCKSIGRMAWSLRQSNQTATVQPVLGFGAKHKIGGKCKLWEKSIFRRKSTSWAKYLTKTLELPIFVTRRNSA